MLSFSEMMSGLTRYSLRNNTHNLFFKLGVKFFFFLKSKKLATFRKKCTLAIKETCENLSLIPNFVTENYMDVS